MTACVECGNDRAVSMSTTGMICRDCQERRNDETRTVNARIAPRRIPEWGLHWFT